MNKAVLLVVDDEPTQLAALSGYLRKQGHTVLTAENGDLGIGRVREHPVDLVLTDMRMPGMGGLALLREAKALNPEIGVVVMTAFGSVEDAVKAMKAGAEDYVQKPVNLEQLDLVIRKALDRRNLASENRKLKETLETRTDFSQIVVGSMKMEEVLNLAGRAARSRVTVLIQGESGTGKEILARAIHLAGPRKDESFVAVNMAALPENLIESELFGHEKGAFTGADRQRKGRFELAGGGTLFIDEVGEIPQAVQVKLLRVLQDRSFERVGSSQTVRTDVRVIAATNQNLEQRIRDGQFREDLFYRLNVIRILVPPLRERKEDIPLLTDHFLRKFSEEEDRPVPSVSREAMHFLMRHGFPGNVRELENMIQRAIVLMRGEHITAEDLAPGGRDEIRDPGGETSDTFTGQVETLEKRLIRGALDGSGGNQSEAARMLGISERHLRYKLKKYGLK